MRRRERAVIPRKMPPIYPSLLLLLALACSYGALTSWTATLGARPGPTPTHAAPKPVSILVRWVRIDPQHPLTIVAEVDRGGRATFVRSGDGGTTWSDIPPARASIGTNPLDAASLSGYGRSLAAMEATGRAPFRRTAIFGVGGAARPGTPVYLFGAGAHGRVRNLLYRSMDGGGSWEQVALGFQWPSALPPDRRPGTLYIPSARHSVGAPFVAIYRRLGVGLLGLPITEAYYTYRGVLQQEFTQMRLERRQGTVLVGPLGGEVAYGRKLRFAAAPRGAAVAGSRYFPRTGHTLGGSFLAYWRANGGEAVFGPPISEVLTETDGGQRSSVQWFENARLEIPTGNGDVIPAPLGEEVLRLRGWIR